MALSILLENVEFQSSIGNVNPMQNRTGLIAEHIYGEPLDDTLKNRVSNQPNMTIVGSPEFYDNYVVVSSGATGSFGFDTRINVTETVTLLAVIGVDSGMPSILSCHQGDEATGGFTGWLNYGGKIDAYNNNVGAQSTPIDPPSHGKFFVVAATIPAGQYHENHVFDAGVKTTKRSGGGAFKGPSPLLVGTTIPGSGAVNGRAKIAYTGVYNRILSESEINAAYKELTEYFEGKIDIA